MLGYQIYDNISYPKRIFKSICYPNNTVVICPKCNVAYWGNHQYKKEICLCGTKVRIATKDEFGIAQEIAEEI